MRGKITKWRGLDHPNQAIVWAHLRLDRIEERLGLKYEPPDLEAIINELQDKSTDEDAYPPKPKLSVFHQFLTQVRIIAKHPYLRHLINCVLRFNKRNSKDNATNESKSKTDDD